MNAPSWKLDQELCNVLQDSLDLPVLSAEICMMRDIVEWCGWMIGNCDKCRSQGEVRHHVLVDYTREGGGWVEEGMYCNKCVTEIEDFMNGIVR